MGVVQRTWKGSKPCISCVVSKSDSDHGTATTATELLGNAGTICRSNLCHYPIPK